MVHPLPPAVTLRRWAGPALMAWLSVLAALHFREFFLFFSRFAPFPPLPAPSAAGLAGTLGGQALRLAGAVLFFRTAWALGNLLRARGVGREDVGPDAPFIDAALGLFALSLLGFFLAAAGAAHPWVLRTAGACLASASFLRPFPGPARAASFWKGSSRLFKAGVLLFVALGAALCAVPETFPDALTYVLPLPAATLREGRLATPDGSVLFFYPAMSEMTYLWGLAFGDDRFCKTLSFGTTLLGAAGLAAWTSRRFGSSAGRWAGLFFLSSPFILLYGTTASNDPFASVFLFAALVLWEGARDDPRGRRILRLALAGFFLGAAAAAKYTALFAAPYFLWDAFRARGGGRLSLAEGAAAGLAFLLPLTPWWTWNVLRGRNPLFPVWPRGGPDLERELLSLIPVEQRGPRAFPGRLGLLFEKSVTGVHEGRYAFAGPFLLAALPAAALLPLRTASWLLFLPVSLAAFASTAGILRYYIPHMPLWFAAAGGAFASWLSRASAPWRSAGKALAAAMLLSLAAAVALASHLFSHAGEPLWGGASAGDYLRRDHTAAFKNPSTGGYAWLKEHPRKGARVYLLGETRSFHSPAPVHMNWVYDAPLYESWIREGLTPAQALSRLREAGITHVLLNPGEFSWAVLPRFRTPDRTAWLSGLLDLLGPPVHRDRWCVLFAVPEEAP